MNQPNLEQRLAVRQRPQNQIQVMHQTWRDLLFLHWEICPEAIQSSLPEGLYVDTWEGKAFLGIVPFLMRNIRPRFVPSIPGISNFHETNLRTYVYDRHGRPGVWFYSLDANQWLAVRVARKLFQLPYFDADMSHSSSQDGKIEYKTTRRSTELGESVFEYQISEHLGEATPGSFEFFLAERYLLFASRDNGKLYSGQVVHPPYPLRRVELKTWDAKLIQLAGFDLPTGPPVSALFSHGVKVDVFPIRPIDK